MASRVRPGQPSLVGRSVPARCWRNSRVGTGRLPSSSWRCRIEVRGAGPAGCADRCRCNAATPLRASGIAASPRPRSPVAMPTRTGTSYQWERSGSLAIPVRCESMIVMWLGWPCELPTPPARTRARPSPVRRSRRARRPWCPRGREWRVEASITSAFQHPRAARSRSRACWSWIVSACDADVDADVIDPARRRRTSVNRHHRGVREPPRSTAASASSTPLGRHGDLRRGPRRTRRQRDVGVGSRGDQGRRFPRRHDARRRFASTGSGVSPVVVPVAGRGAGGSDVTALMLASRGTAARAREDRVGSSASEQAPADAEPEVERRDDASWRGDDRGDRVHESHGGRPYTGVGVAVRIAAHAEVRA